MSSLNISRLLLVFLPLINFGPILGGKLTFAHLISLGLFVIWAFQGRLRLVNPSFAYALAFLTLVTFNVMISTIWSSNFEQITQLVNYGLMMIVMIVGYTLALREHLEPRTILESYFRVGIAYAVISVVLYLYGMFDSAFLYAVTNFFNNANTFDQGGISGQLSEMILPRITGLSPEPSFWSMYMCSVLAVGLVLGRRLWGCGMLFLALVILLTLARTGMVIASAMVLYLLLKRAPLVLVVVVALTLAIVLPFVDYDISGSDNSITQRFGSLAEGWKAFLGAPLLGLGWGGFKEYSKTNLLDYPVIFNYYLQVAAEAGIVGLTLLVLFLISLVVNVSRNSRMVLLVIFVAWFSAPSYNLPYAWFLFGVLLAARRRQGRNNTPLALPQPS